MNFKSQMINSPSMVTERRKYISGILKNLGFALLTPCGSLMFQWLVFKKELYSGYFHLTVIIFILGWMLLVSGYIPLKEKSNE